jgi:hypothetical protein
VGFVVDKVALGQVFSEYFGFPFQSSFHQLLHNHPHLSSGAGTIGQKWPQYKGLSPTPLPIIIIKIIVSDINHIIINIAYHLKTVSRDTSVGMAMGYGLDNFESR